MLLGLIAASSGRHCCAGLAFAAIGAVVGGTALEARAEPALDYALIVSGGFTGSGGGKLFLYEDGLVLRASAGQGKRLPFGELAEPAWQAVRLEAVAHDALVAALRTKLKAGRSCRQGEATPDGFDADIYETHGAASPPIVYTVRLTEEGPKGSACKALVAAYDRLDALWALPGEAWQPTMIVVTVIAASPQSADRPGLAWPEGWHGIDDPTTRVDSIGRFQITLDAAADTRDRLNELVRSAREQNLPILIDGRPSGIAYPVYLAPGEAMLEGAVAPDR